MNSLLPFMFGAAVVAGVAGLLWAAIGRRPVPPSKEDHLQALDLWLDGDLPGAGNLLRKVIQNDPHAIDPYLQLGNLMRLMGDPQRASVLHRGLTVRPDLPLTKKMAVGLSLAEDLIALERWADVGQVLDSLLHHADGTSRYWKARFHQHYGQENLPDAARALKAARTHVPEHDRPWFNQAYAAFQLDRALAHVLHGEAGDAEARLKDVAKIPEAKKRAALVRAMLSAATGEHDAALEETAGSLMDSPEELSLFLPFLQSVLLAKGQYAKTIPILEAACQPDNSPASFTVHLALLYQKLGDHERAVQLILNKRGAPDLTPDAAAPYLRLLASAEPDSDMSRVWHALSLPPPDKDWRCRACGNISDHIRWFCGSCRSFDTFAQIEPPRRQAR